MSEAKVRIRIGNNEIEILGEESFVERRLDELEALLQKLSVVDSQYQLAATQAEEQPDLRNGIGDKVGAFTSQLPGTFGEWYSKFPTKLRSIQKVLIAAYYIQETSGDGSFQTANVNRLLKEQSIKVSNTSKTVQRLQQKKYVFVDGKAGKKIKKYKVSEEGKNYIFSLLGQ